MPLRDDRDCYPMPVRIPAKAQDLIHNCRGLPFARAQVAAPTAGPLSGPGPARQLYRPGDYAARQPLMKDQEPHN